MAIIPIKRIRTANGDAPIHVDAIIDDNGNNLATYIQTIAPGSGSSDGGSVDLSAYSTTEEMNSAISKAQQDAVNLATTQAELYDTVIKNEFNSNIATAKSEAISESQNYTDQKIAEIDFPNVNADDIADLKTMIRKNYYYANPDIDLSKASFLKFVDTPDGKYGASITFDTDLSTLVIPYDLYESIWTDDVEYTDTLIISDHLQITKIIIPRGMKFRHPNNTEDMGDEGLVELFPNLETIVRIHEDGAVLSYNIKTGALN